LKIELLRNVETRSLPTLAHCFPHNFTFYVAHPIRSVREQAAWRGSRPRRKAKGGDRVEKQTLNAQRPTSNVAVPDLRKERGLVPQQLENVDSALSLCFQGNVVRDKLAQVELLTRVVDVDPHQISFSVVIQHDSFRNFLALGALLVREIDVKGIGIWKIIEFHGLNLRSRNALCIVSLSERVMTRKKRPPSSSTLPQKRYWSFP
jgi:hypothetical protein